MKQERIEELLAGSKYDAVTLHADWGYSAHFKAGEAAWLDAKLNAARVQLLTKALYWVEAWLVEEADTTQGISRKDAAQRVRDALKEAGLEG